MSMPIFPPTAPANSPWVSVGNGGKGRWGEFPASSPFQKGYTYAVQGALAVPSGATNFLPPFFLPIEPGVVVTLIGVRGMVRGGTNVTISIQRNGSNVSGLTGLTITTSPSSFAPTIPVDASDGDYFAPLITAISGTPDGLSLTFYFRAQP